MKVDCSELALVHIRDHLCVATIIANGDTHGDLLVILVHQVGSPDERLRIREVQVGQLEGLSRMEHLRFIDLIVRVTPLDERIECDILQRCLENALHKLLHMLILGILLDLYWILEPDDLSLIDIKIAGFHSLVSDLGLDHLMEQSHFDIVFDFLLLDLRLFVHAVQIP